MVRKSKPQASPLPRRRPARQELNAKPFLATAADTAEHFYACATGGEEVDRRRLGDVLHHEEPEHEPISVQPAAAGRLGFIPPLLPTLVDEVRRATAGCMRSSTTATALKW